MFKKIFWIILGILLVGGLVFGAVNRTLAKNGSDSPVVALLNINSEARELGLDSEECEEEGISGGIGNGAAGMNAGSDEHQDLIEANLPAADPLGLSADEAAALSYMREEEKLAHDVYLRLYELWGKQTFLNIANGEQAHTDSVLALLERYGIEDPAAVEAGVFTTPDLQTMYDQLIARGSISLDEALRVGGLIEEVDILDLQERLAQTGHADIQQVFTSLFAGSQNHLRAFTRVLQNQVGASYQPQVMSLEAYQAIAGGTPGPSGYSNSGSSANRSGQP